MSKECKVVGWFVWWTPEESPKHVNYEFFRHSISGCFENGEELSGVDYVNAIVEDIKANGRYAMKIGEVGYTEALVWSIT